MERKIQWNSGCFDEMDLVYDKAADKEATSKILADLEVGALAEAKAYSDKIIVEGRPLTPQQFDALPDSMKEQVMYQLSGMGLASFSAPLTEPKIVVRLSPHIQNVRCCTAFSILNRLEKLDGAFNVLHPQATLEIQAPLGGKQGLVQIEMLISMLYPWLKVTEVSSNEVAANLMQTQPKPQQKPVEQKAPVATQPQVQKKPSDEAENARPGFWARLFGKKKKNEGKPRYTLDYIMAREGFPKERVPGAFHVRHDQSMGKWHLRIQLDNEHLWYLSVFIRDDGSFEKYSLDKEAANDSHYEFVEEQKIRKSIYSVGDENKYFHEILIPYVYAFGGEALLNKIMPYVTEQFHFY